MKLSGPVVFVSEDARRCVVRYDAGYALFRLKKPKRGPAPGDLVKAKIGDDGRGSMKRRKKKLKVWWMGSWPRALEAVAKAQHG